MDAEIEAEVLKEIHLLFSEAPGLITDENEDEVVDYMMDVGEKATLEASKRDLNRGQMALGVVLVAHSVLDQDSPLNDPNNGLFEK